VTKVIYDRSHRPTVCPGQDCTRTESAAFSVHQHLEVCQVNTLVYGSLYLISTELRSGLFGCQK